MILPLMILPTPSKEIFSRAAIHACRELVESVHPDHPCEIFFIPHRRAENHFVNFLISPFTLFTSPFFPVDCRLLLLRSVL